MKEFLKECAEHYYIVVYANGSKSYVNKVLNCIDPFRKYISRVLYDKHVFKHVYPGGSFKIKDLRLFDAVLENTVIVDDQVTGFAFHLEHGVPVMPFFGSKADNELETLSHYLNQHLLAKAKAENKTISEVNKKMAKLHICLVKMRALDADYNFSLMSKAFTSSGESVSNKDFFKPNYFNASEWDETKTINSIQDIICKSSSKMLINNGYLCVFTYWIGFLRVR